MSRLAVTGAFLAMAAATAVGLVSAWRDALADPEVRSYAVAGYTVLRLAVVLAFTYFVFVRGPARRPSRDPVAFAACALAVGAIVALRQPTDEGSAAIVVAGDLLALGACVWLLVSVLALGRCFGVLPEARGLVTRGPYRLVRHPVYLGELGACAGLVLAAPTPWNLGVGLVFAASQAIRMRLEEAALTEEFPEYADYALATPSLVPRLRLRRAHLPRFSATRQA